MHTIVLASSLPDITESVFVDGWSQPGFQSKPLIELTTVGGAAGGGPGLMSNFITVRGLILNRFVGSGIFIGPFAWTSVQGCYIGTDQAGLVAAPNGEGIRISGGSHNLIGGSGEGAGNLISGNNGSGITIEKKIASGTPDITPPVQHCSGQLHRDRCDRLGSRADSEWDLHFGP